MVDEPWLQALRDSLSQAGHEVGDGESYPLHPVTMAHKYWERYPKQIQCLELRRDLLVNEFTPFRQMVGDIEKVRPIARAIADAIPE